MSTETTNDHYFRGVCRWRICASYTAAGNVASYWHGPLRSDRASAEADYDAHVATRHTWTAVAGA